MFRLTVSSSLACRFFSWYSLYPAFFSDSRASISAVSSLVEGSLVIPLALKKRTVSASDKMKENAEEKM